MSHKLSITQLHYCYRYRGKKVVSLQNPREDWMRAILLVCPQSVLEDTLPTPLGVLWKVDTTHTLHTRVHELNTPGSELFHSPMCLQCLSPASSIS